MKIGNAYSGLEGYVSIKNSNGRSITISTDEKRELLEWFVRNEMELFVDVYNKEIGI